MRGFDLKGGLLGLCHDVSLRADDVDPEELLVWLQSRLVGLDKQYRSFKYFNSKEYINKFKKVKV